MEKVTTRTANGTSHSLRRSGEEKPLIRQYAEKLVANHRGARPAVIRTTRDLANFVIWATMERLNETMPHDVFRDLCAGALVALRISESEGKLHLPMPKEIAGGDSRPTIIIRDVDVQEVK